MSFIQNPVQIVTKRIIFPVNNTIDYPMVIGMQNTIVQQSINRAILSLVYKLVSDQGYYQEPTTTTINGWYEIKTNERGILSLSIGNYTYHYHAAHSMTIIKSLTFDIQTGKSYDLADLFKPDSNYVKVLSDIIGLQIKTRKIDLLGEFKGIAPNQDYYIADKALVVYFQLYEITPYVYGFPFFPISVYEIQNIIKENGPLDLMSINY